MFRTFGSESRVVVRIVAALIVCAFAALPTLTRLNDRLSSSDASPRFRVSKNLERPHEKQVTATLVRTACCVAPHLHVVDAPALAGVSIPNPVSHVPFADRAPPVLV